METRSLEQERTDLSVIDLACAEQRVQGVVGRDGESSRVDEELASDVEEDKEEVDGAQAEELDIHVSSLITSERT